MQTNRRRFLAASGAVLAGLAGCLDGESGDGGPIQWKYDVGGSPRTVHDDLVYATEDFSEGSGGLVAIEKQTGERAWGYGETGGYTMFTKPEVADAVYLGFGDDVVGGGSGSLHAVEHDGTERWTINIGSVYQRPRYVDGTVVAAADDSTVRAVDAEDGSDVWVVDIERFSPDPPSLEAVVDGRAYVGLDEALLVFDAEDGDELWTYSIDGRMNRPAVAGETAYLTTSKGIAALDTSNGEERWHVDHDGGVVTARDGRVYTARRGQLCTLDVDDGAERWCEPISGLVRHVGDRGVYVGETTLQLVDQEGETSWTTEVNGELDSLSVDDGTVYALTAGTVNKLDSSGEITATESVARIREHTLGEYLYVGTDDAMYALDL